MRDRICGQVGRERGVQMVAQLTRAVVADERDRLKRCLKRWRGFEKVAENVHFM